MILQAFSDFLKQYEAEIMTGHIEPLELLPEWLISQQTNIPKSNIEKIISSNIMCFKNKNGDIFVVGTSESGRRLLTTLNEFCNGYKNYTNSKLKEQMNKNYYK